MLSVALGLSRAKQIHEIKIHPRMNASKTELLTILWQPFRRQLSGPNMNRALSEHSTPQTTNGSSSGSGSSSKYESGRVLPPSIICRNSSRSISPLPSKSTSSTMSCTNNQRLSNLPQQTFQIAINHTKLTAESSF